MTKRRRFCGLGFRESGPYVLPIVLLNAARWSTKDE
jgi:hypothetical protein